LAPQLIATNQPERPISEAYFYKAEPFALEVVAAADEASLTIALTNHRPFRHHHVRRRTSLWLAFALGSLASPIGMADAKARGRACRADRFSPWPLPSAR
jgi:hypothetical protein